MANNICSECKSMPTNHTYKVCGALVFNQCSCDRVFDDLNHVSCKDCNQNPVKFLSSLSFHNSQLIIHAGYVEDLRVIPDSRVEGSLRMIFSIRTSRKERQIIHLLHICLCKNGFKMTENLFILFMLFFYK